MPTTLTTNAIEQSTYSVTFSFADTQGNAVTPNELTWTLVDTSANVINSREDVSITPGTSVTIVLSGDDLTLSEGTGKERVLKIKGTYNSSLGTNLPLKDEATFTIDDLVSVG